MINLIPASKMSSAAIISRRRQQCLAGAGIRASQYVSEEYDRLLEKKTG